MALRRCLRFSVVVPRLLWSRSVPPGSVCSPVITHPGCRSTHLLLRTFSSSPPTTDVGYERMKQLLASREAVVIDVREPWELREYGFIPGSINVPLGQVDTALQLSPDEFKEKYGGEMPRQTDKIVFTCLAGVRSKNAWGLAFSLGYKDVQNYAGGWKDWAKNEEQK